MFKKVQIALVATAAVLSIAAGSTQNVAGWWTDHEPNHIIAPTTVPTGGTTTDGWWTDHEPNH